MTTELQKRSTCVLWNIYQISEVFCATNDRQISSVKPLSINMVKGNAGEADNLLFFYSVTLQK